MRHCLTILAVCFATGAYADPWIMHPFGELRSYHGDWLAVCDDLGKGPCRLVHLGQDPYVRVAILVNPTAVEVTLGAAEGDWSLVDLALDGQAFDLPDYAWTLGLYNVPNVVGSCVVMEDPVLGDLIAKLKSANRLNVQMDGAMVSVPLRGVTAGLRAIEARKEQK